MAERVREHLIGDPDAESAVAGNLPDARQAPGLVTETMARLDALAMLGTG